MKKNFPLELDELVAMIILAFFVVLIGWTIYQGSFRPIIENFSEKRSAPVVLETKLGLETEYKGHKIVYNGLTHTRLGSNALTARWSDDVNLAIDGRQVVLSPGAYLDEISIIDQPLYAFFLPDGEELYLKEVSKDRALLRWTNKDWSKK